MMYKPNIAAVLSIVLAVIRCVRAEQQHFGVQAGEGAVDRLAQDSSAVEAQGRVSLLEASQPISTTSDTIVSVLSTSGQHTILLHLLQRAKCIPLLAHIGNATLFAPTDTAWQDWASSHTASMVDGDMRIGGGQDRAGGWLGAEGLTEWQMSYDDALSLRLEGGANVEEEQREFDNQNWALRQHLLYHMLNYTLSPASLLAQPAQLSGGAQRASNSNSARRNVTTLTTLLFPLANEPPLPPTPEPGSPWLPRGGQGLLGGKGQRLRLARGGSAEGGERGRVGCEWDGQGGAAVWSGKWGDDTNQTVVQLKKDRRKDLPGARWASNGVVIGIDGVLDMPPSIDEIIRSHPSLSYLSSLLPPSYLAQSQELPSPLPSNLSSAGHLTIFAPADQAFDRFDEVEKRYLEGDFGGEAIARVLGGGVIDTLGGKEEVGWTDYWGKKADNVVSVTGEGLQVSVDDAGSLSVNGTAAEQVDIFASNGVLHIVPDLLVPPHFNLLNNAEKVLLSLNATRFVSLLRSANLSSSYAGDAKGKAWTILAPTDEVMDAVSQPEWGRPLPMPRVWAELASPQATMELEVGMMKGKHPEERDSPLAALLKYHIIPGKLAPSDIKDGMLLGTEMQLKSLGGARQKLRADVSDRFDRHDWDVQRGEIRFGGAAVAGKPVKSGNSIIYLLSSLLAPPDSILRTAVSDLQLSTFIAAVYAAELDHAVLSTPAVSYFIPRNKAFSALGLTMQYLLLPEGKDDLRQVVKYHAVNKLIYSPDMQEGRETYETLHGGDVVLEYTPATNATKESIISLSSPKRWADHDSGESLPANGEIRPAQVTSSDALASTGVIHVIDSVVMPADVSISIDKLVQGSRQNTMADLMVRAGLSWVLEGREPSRDEVQRAGLEGSVRAMSNDSDPVPDIDELALPGYVVLVPSDAAFSRINMTAYLADPDELLKLLKMHIIPTQPSVPRTQGTKEAASAPKDGHPLSLDDDLVYQTLLSASSKYGELAIRATGDSSFLIGVRGARGGYGVNAARVGDSGRARVRWRKNQLASRMVDEDLDRVRGTEGNVLWRGGVTLGGGVVLLDNVLIPYEPSWFSRWGWLVITLSGIGAMLIFAGLFVAWWYFVRTKDEVQYEPLEGEEDE